MRWKVRGADEKTGAEHTIEVAADSQADAESKARYQGLLVESAQEAVAPAGVLGYAGQPHRPSLWARALDGMVALSERKSASRADDPGCLPVGVAVTIVLVAVLLLINGISSLMHSSYRSYSAYDSRGELQYDGALRKMMDHSERAEQNARSATGFAQIATGVSLVCVLMLLHVMAVLGRLNRKISSRGES